MQTFMKQLLSGSSRRSGLWAAVVTVSIWTAFIIIARASARHQLLPLDITWARIMGASAVLRMSFEHDANAAAEYAKFVAQTTRLVRIKHEGSALTGSTYSKKPFMIDFAGRYTAFPPFEAQDGDDIVNVELQAGYNTTADLFCRFLLVNALAAVV